MPAQTTYTINTGRAYPGLLADQVNHEIVTGVAEDSGIAFGRAVSRGTADRQCVIGGSEYLGISVRDLAREGEYDAAGAVAYRETESVSVLRRGRIFLTAPAGAVVGDAVKYNTTTGVVGAGAAGSGELAIPGATWENTVSAGQVGVVRFSGQVETAAAGS